MKVKVQKIGNSKSINLPGKEKVSISAGNKHVIAATNKSRREWEAQFKTAIANGDKPENNFSEDIENDFDKTEWTWE